MSYINLKGNTKVFIHENNLSLIDDKIMAFNEEFPHLNLKYDFNRSDEQMFELEFDYDKTFNQIHLIKFLDSIDNFVEIILV